VLFQTANSAFFVHQNVVGHMAEDQVWRTSIFVLWTGSMEQAPIRASSSLDVFERKLKAHCFNEAFSF